MDEEVRLDLIQLFGIGVLMRGLKSYAVKKAEIRKAGTVQKECLVINLDGTSFYSAALSSKVNRPGQALIAHVGISNKGQYVFEWEGNLYVRYPRYELTGKDSCFNRNAAARAKAKANASTYYKRKDGRVSGSVHLWGGDIAWGGKGKMALKPFTGTFREDWRI